MSISSFGEDRDGELYFTNVGGGAIHRLRRPSGAPTGEFPTTLSATGCFDDLATRHPAPGLIPYDVQSPLWSDGAAKRRFLVLPEGATIGHMMAGTWSLPEGTILVKEFSYELELGNPASRRALETRFLLPPRERLGRLHLPVERRADRGLPAGCGDDRDVPRHRPAATRSAAHAHARHPESRRLRSMPQRRAGGALGLQTAQLNRTVRLRRGQRQSTARVRGRRPLRAVPTGAPGESPAPRRPERRRCDPRGRARSYLQANCAHCHRPGGTAPTAIDLRAETRRSRRPGSATRSRRPGASA